MIKLVTTFFLISCSSIIAQHKTETYSLADLKLRFKNAEYSENVLTEFRETLVNLRDKPYLNEEVPGEIISWYTMIGQFSIHRTYRIQRNKLTEVKTIPSDAAFLEKLNSYVPPQSRFTYSSDDWSFAFVIKKLADGYFLISATTKSFNSYPDFPSDDVLIYNLEYRTNDFKTFRLSRYKESKSDVWIDVKQ